MVFFGVFFYLGLIVTSIMSAKKNIICKLSRRFVFCTKTKCIKEGVQVYYSEAKSTQAVPQLAAFCI